MVFFWLKPETDEALKQNMIDDCHELLGSMPMVKQLWAGTAAGTPREIVDNSYSVGLIVHLEDAAAHDQYQTHENHQAFIQRYKDHWARVLVFDTFQ